MGTTGSALTRVLWWHANARRDVSDAAARRKPLSLRFLPRSVREVAEMNSYLVLRVDFFFFFWSPRVTETVTEASSMQTHKHTLSPYPGLNPYRCCWCCYGLLWCWSDLILHLRRTATHTHTHTHPSHTFIHAFIHLRHLKHDANCLYPYFVFNSFLLLLFYLYFVAYCIEESYIDLHTKHLSLPLLFKLYPMRNKERTLLLLYHTTVLLTIKLFSH